MFMEGSGRAIMLDKRWQEAAVVIEGWLSDQILAP